MAKCIVNEKLQMLSKDVHVIKDLPPFIKMKTKDDIFKFSGSLWISLNTLVHLSKIVFSLKNDHLYKPKIVRRTKDVSLGHSDVEFFFKDGFSFKIIENCC